MTEIPLCRCEPPVPCSVRKIRNPKSANVGKLFFGCAKFGKNDEKHCDFFELTPDDFVMETTTAVNGKGKPKVDTTIRKVDENNVKLKSLAWMYAPRQQ